MQKELRRKLSAFQVRYNNLQSVKNKITQYRITITAPDLLLPVIAVFPSTAEQGSVQVDSGPSRNIRVEGVGVDIDGIEKVLIAAQTVVSLELQTNNCLCCNQYLLNTININTNTFYTYVT